MAEPSFYNTNENRFYPLLAETGYAALLERVHSAIVDFGAVIGPDAAFSYALHGVYLSSISRTGSTFSFEFGSTAPLLVSLPLVFTRDINDAPYTTEFVEINLPFDAVEDSVGPTDTEAEAACSEQFFWSGFLVTGDLTMLTELIGDGESFAGSPELLILPELLQNLGQGFVNTLNLANADRTRAEAPENCDPLEWDQPLGQVYPSAQCIQGDVRLKAGYNLAIRQNTVEGEIELSAVVGAGEGEVCEDVPLFEDEAPPEGRETLDGALGCREVLRSINGIGGRVLNLIGGKGVTVVPDAAENRVLVNIDMSDLQTCFLEPVEEVSESI